MRHVTTKGLNKCFFDREEARSGPTSSIVVVVVGNLLENGTLSDIKYWFWIRWFKKHNWKYTMKK